MYQNKGEILGPSDAQVATAAAVVNLYKVERAALVSRLKYTVSVLFDSAADTIIKYYRRPVFGSAAGQVLLGQLAIPTGAAPGECHFKDIQGVHIEEGEELSVEVDVAATVAGSGQGSFECEEDPESSANNSAMIEQ